jgi:hypothetical protein
MTRILYWNLENFAENKINSVDPGRQVGSTVSRTQAAQNRLYYLGSVLRAVGPDVFVVVEVESSPHRGAGELAVEAGARGCLTLLGHLRTVLPAENWDLVPPLQTGPNEAVAVFYRHDRLTFCGPSLWPGGLGPSVRADDPQARPPGNYPALMDGALPAGALVPRDGHWPNAGQCVRQCAANTSYEWSLAQAADGIGRFDWGARERAPYQVCFLETPTLVPPIPVPAPPAPDANTRVLTVFAVHAPAHAGVAEEYLRNLSRLAEITEGQGPHEVRVVVGDFNVNLMDDQFATVEPYHHLMRLAPPYSLLLQPQAPLPGHLHEGFADYFATHIRHRYSAVCWSTQAERRVAPGYGYTGSDFGPPASAIDNAFVRYLGPGHDPDAHFTIVNPVVGSPYPDVVGGGPTGTVLFGRLIDAPPSVLGHAPDIAPDYTPGLASNFRAWGNYGYLRSTSDHLPLVMDV